MKLTHKNNLKVKVNKQRILHDAICKKAGFLRLKSGAWSTLIPWGSFLHVLKVLKPEVREKKEKRYYLVL